MSTYSNYKNKGGVSNGRLKTIGASCFVAALVLTIAITGIALSVGGGPKKNNETGGGINNDPPVNAPVVFGLPVSSYSGILKGFSSTELQYNETMRRWESHKLITMEAGLGTPVLATFNGRVTSVRDHTLFGRQITIDHERDGLVTVLSNLDPNTSVREGDRVTKGQQVGTVGQTSNIEFVNTPHLRVEVLQNGQCVNPNDLIDFPIK
jgi:murein DD-endopeptidase MepM/ murein hydrolase activator NlpD